MYAHPNGIIAHNLIRICNKLQWIRDELKRPIFIVSGYRPPVYNTLIRGSKKSAHMTGDAIDFTVHDMSADEVRHRLIPKLIELDVRMEKLPGSSWVHIDHKPVKKKRYFKP
jgi:uncharacterized protein YcbK (DUF882 family)